MGNIQPVFENLFNILPFGIVLITDNHTIDYVNPKMIEILHFSDAKELIGQEIIRFISEDDKNPLRHLIHSDRQSQSNSKNWKLVRFIDALGLEKPLLINFSSSLSQLDRSDVRFLSAVPMDHINLETISPNVLGKAAFPKTSHNEYKNIFDQATIGITILNKDGIILLTNQTFANQFGLNRSDLINQSCADLIKHPSRKRFDVLFERAKRSDLMYVKDVITIEDDGNAQKILEISISKMEKSKDFSQDFMLITEDITHQEDTHAALLQSEKLSLTGRLAASLAHEINNPLQVSLGCLGLVEEMLDDCDKDLNIYIKLAIDELQRSARIVKKLRDLNRTTDLSERGPVDIHELLNGALILTKNRLKDRNIVPVFTYQGPPPIVHASKDLIQQVILNLFMNAIDALPNGGNIFLDIILSDDPKGVTINIRDTGVGIETDLQNDLFDPFFTTKDDGLGLGLYISRNIIEDHAGSLTYTSEAGKGTEFSIWLPGFDPAREKEQ